MAKKLRPIKPIQSDISSYRGKLNILIKRMRRDYEVELKPLIKKMSNEQRKQLSKIKEAPNVLASDAEKFFTAYEVSRILNTIKKRVERDVESGKVKGAFFKDGTWLIPEDSIQGYAKLIGKKTEQNTLLAKFNRRLQRLRDKYQDLIYAYEDMAKKEIQNSYKEAKNKFKNNFKKATGINITNKMTERGLKESFDAQVAENVSLIGNIPESYFSKISQMVTQSVTGEKKFEGGIIQALEDLGISDRKKTKLIARDQISKATSTFTSLRAQNVGSIGYQWHNSGDRRVAGNPNGLYPDVNPNSKYHGNHWDREDKYYLYNRMTGKIPIAPDGKPFRQPPPDGAPGMGINCRCFMEPVFLED